jgi:hypothetical protein
MAATLEMIEICDAVRYVVDGQGVHLVSDGAVHTGIATRLPKHKNTASNPWTKGLSRTLSMQKHLLIPRSLWIVVKLGMRAKTYLRS